MKKSTIIASGIAASAIAAAASADITVTLTGQTYTGFNFAQAVDYTQFNIVGTFTGASINVTLDASTAYTYADDLCVYVDVEPLSSAGFLQCGGFSNLGAAQRYFWPNGASSAVGTTSVGTVNFTTALAFSGNKAVDGTIWIGNGYGASGTSGTWTGTITLHGVDAVAVPAPGAIALLGLAGLAGRRRR
jgi:MYXO-CTERM domain-containing protein